LGNYPHIKPQHRALRHNFPAVNRSENILGLGWGNTLWQTDVSQPSIKLVMIDYQLMQPGESSAVPQESPAQRTNPTVRILIVEDDQDILQLNNEVLSQVGYRVETAANGAIAWDLLQIETFDLLVTDNEMPEVTGLELLQKLHAARMILPVIMATGDAPKEEFTRHPCLQPAATLIKPYTLDELVGTVREVLGATLAAVLGSGQPFRQAGNSGH